jgi:hypothetical protein
MNSIYKIHAGVPVSVLILSTLGVLVVVSVTAGIKVWQIYAANLSEALKAE